MSRFSARDPEGKLRTIVFGYACHAPLYSVSISGAPTIPDLLKPNSNGSIPKRTPCFGRGVARTRIRCRDALWNWLREYGRRLAHAVEDASTAPMTPVAANVEATYREVPLPLDKLPTRETIEKDAESKDSFVAAREDVFA